VKQAENPFSRLVIAVLNDKVPVLDLLIFYLVNIRFRNCVRALYNRFRSA